jgi:predicted CopG family antitoxin
MNTLNKSLNKRRTITLKGAVYSRLSEEGKFNETFSELVTRILNELEKGRDSHEY